MKHAVSNSINSELVKLSSSPGTASLSAEQKEPFDSMQIDQKMVIESLTSPPYPMEPLFMPAALIMSGLTPTTYSQTLQSQHEHLCLLQKACSAFHNPFHHTELVLSRSNSSFNTITKLLLRHTTFGGMIIRSYALS